MTLALSFIQPMKSITTKRNHRNINDLSTYSLLIMRMTRVVAKMGIAEIW